MTIELLLDRYSYLPGDIMKGICNFNLQGNKHTVSLTFMGIELIKPMYGKYLCAADTKSKILFKETQIIFKGKGQEITQDFSFKVPECPPSFRSDHGIIEYYIKATIHKKFKSETFKALFQVDHHDLIPLSDSMEVDLHHSANYLNGEVLFNIKLNKTFLLTTELKSIQLTIDITNNSKRIVQFITIELVQETTYKAGRHVAMDKNQLFYDALPIIVKQDSQCSNSSLIIPKNIFFPSFKGNYINYHYKIIVECGFSKSKKKFHHEIQIVVGHAFDEAKQISQHRF